MILLASLLRSTDVFVGPLWFRGTADDLFHSGPEYKDERSSAFLLRPSISKWLVPWVFTIVNSYYYRGGDTEMYFNCGEYLQKAGTGRFKQFLEDIHHKGHQCGKHL